MKRVMLVLGTVLMITALGIPAQADPAEAITIKDVPFTAENSCPPEELVVGTATYHAVMHRHADEHGVKIRVLIKQVEIKAVGTTTGAAYHGQVVLQNIEIVQGPGATPTEVTQVFQVNLVREGSLDDYLLHVTVHFTVNANGVVTASHNNTFIECKG